MLKRRIKNRIKYGKDILDFEAQDGVDLYKPAVKGFITFEGRDTTKFNNEAYDFTSNSYVEIIEESKEKHAILADLEDFIQILKAKGITPILITLPNYTEYVEYLNKSYIDQYVEASKKLVDKYNIEYWNFLDSDKFTINDFYDMEHLNRKGAFKFSTMLNDSIRKREKESMFINNTSIRNN